MPLVATFVQPDTEDVVIALYKGETNVVEALQDTNVVLVASEKGVRVHTSWGASEVLPWEFESHVRLSGRDEAAQTSILLELVQGIIFSLDLTPIAPSGRAEFQKYVFAYINNLQVVKSEESSFCDHSIAAIGPQSFSMHHLIYLYFTCKECDATGAITISNNEVDWE